MEPPTPAGQSRVPRAPDRAIELPMTLLVPRHHARGRSAPPQNAGSVTVGRAPCATMAPVEAVGGGRPAPGSTGPCSSGSRAGTTRAASTPRSATAPPPKPTKTITTPSPPKQHDHHNQPVRRSASSPTRILGRFLGPASTTTLTLTLVRHSVRRHTSFLPWLLCPGSRPSTAS